MEDLNISLVMLVMAIIFIGGAAYIMSGPTAASGTEDTNAALGVPASPSASVERKGEESANEFLENRSGLPTQTEKLLQTIISNQQDMTSILQKQLQTLIGIRWGIIGFAIWFVVEFIILRNR